MLKTSLRIGSRLAAMLFVGLCFLSCSISFGDRAATIRLAVSVPASGSRAVDGSGSRAIAAGTASFLIRLEGVGMDVPRETTVAAPVSGGTAELSLDAVPFGEKTLTIFSRDGSGATISWGSATIQVTSSVVHASVDLDQVAPEYSLSALGSSAVSSLAAKAVRVIAFTPPAESWNDYSISIMYSPCELSVFDYRLKRIALVGKADGSAATAEKWALVTRAAAGDSFYIMIANTTSAPRSVQLRLERAFYVRYGGSSSGSPQGGRQSPYAGISLADAYSAIPPTLQPVRCVVSGTGSSAFSEQITLSEGKSLYGGFDPVAWNRDIDAFPTRISIDFSTNDSVLGQAVLDSSGITQATVMDGMAIDCGSFVSSGSSGATFEGLFLNNGSPIISNNSIKGAAVDPRGMNGKTVESYGIAMGIGARGAIIAYNRVQGGSIALAANGSGTDAINCAFNFNGVWSVNTASASRIFVGNDITGWLGNGTAADALDTANGIASNGMYLDPSPSARDYVLNNAIDAGRTENWTGSVLPNVRGLVDLDTDSYEVFANNLIGYSGNSHQLSSYLAMLPAVDYQPFSCNFFFRASSAISFCNYSIASTQYNGPTEQAGTNIGIFPAQSGDFGNHRLSGNIDNSNVDPARMGSDLSGLVGSDLSEFEGEFILWDRSGKTRTIPYSAGCYERD